MTETHTLEPMPITAIAPWFGAKRTLAPTIVEQLGPHTAYFEPFCGSMAVLLAKPPTKYETVNDLHGDLTNLARVLQDEHMAVELYARLARTLFVDGILEEAVHRINEESTTITSPERAYWYFIASWMARNGTAGTWRTNYQLAVRYTGTGGAPTTRWANAVASIPAWHHRLRNVVILRRDAFSILNRFEDLPTTAIYADPPYILETRTARSNAQDAHYMHEFRNQAAPDGTPDDHTRLAEALHEYRRARIVVSYYDHPRVRELYADWAVLTCYRQKNLARANGKSLQPDEAQEILLVNGPLNLSTRKGDSLWEQTTPECS